VPEKKVTVPLGALPLLVVVMLAVNVTDEPSEMLVALDWAADVVVDFVIVNATGVDVDAWKLGSLP